MSPKAAWALGTSKERARNSRRHDSSRAAAEQESPGRKSGVSFENRCEPPGRHKRVAGVCQRAHHSRITRSLPDRHHALEIFPLNPRKIPINMPEEPAKPPAAPFEPPSATPTPPGLDLGPG